MTKAIDLTISSDEEPSPNSRSLKDYVKSKECLLREKKHSPLVHLASFYDDLEWSLESDTFDFLKGTFFQIDLLQLIIILLVCIQVAARRNIGYARKGKEGFDRSTAIYLALEQAAMEAIVYDNSRWTPLPQLVKPGESPFDIIKSHKVRIKG